MTLIRREIPADHGQVRALQEAAFAAVAHASGHEAELVDALRDGEDWAPRLSFVAETEGKPVGHVICSYGRLAGKPVIGLGPIGVDPAFQGRGIGSALMHAVIGAAEATGEPAIVLLGDPEFYGRFGFVPAERHGVIAPDPAWGQYFQVAHWRRGTTGSRAGTTTPPPSTNSADPGPRPAAPLGRPGAALVAGPRRAGPNRCLKSYCGLDGTEPARGGEVMMVVWGPMMMVLMLAFWVAVIWGGVAIARGVFGRRLTGPPAAGEIGQHQSRRQPADPRLLVSDAERRAVVNALEHHTRVGRLTMAEFDERSARAWAARTAGELADITADLPPAEDR